MGIFKDQSTNTDETGIFSKVNGNDLGFRGFVVVFQCESPSDCAHLLRQVIISRMAVFPFTVLAFKGLQLTQA